MSESSGTSNPERRLQANGEQLRVRIDAPATGGGDKFEPFTAEEARELLLPQIETALGSVRQLNADERASDHLYVEATLLPNYIAASDYPDDLLTRIGAVPVGSRLALGEYRTKARIQEDAPTRTLILAIPDAGLDDLLGLVASAGGTTRSDRGAFAEIRKLSSFGLPRFEDVVVETLDGDTDEPVLFEAVLHPRTTAFGEPVPLDEVTLSHWADFVGAHRGEMVGDYVRVVGGLTFTPVYLFTSELNAVARFNPLRGIRPMPGMRPRPGIGTRSTMTLLPPLTASTTASEPQVAVFDGGVDTTSGSPGPYFPIVVADLTPAPPARDLIDHGTGVTGAALYGLVRSGDQAPEIPLPTESFRVLPQPATGAPALDAYWVLDRIREVVEQGDHKIVNLSLGPDEPVSDSGLPNRWTSELDMLAWEYDVLFVVAAGNAGTGARHVGAHRVQVPGDMVNGLTVGACDRPAPTSPWNRADYSSMGPGRAGCRAQPIGVQFGGHPGTEMFPVLRTNGTFLEDGGTSYAAPVHTHALAELTTKLPRANPSVLRAFSAHFAERPSRRSNQLFPEVGHGRFPLSFDAALDCGPDEVSVLYVDEINRGELIGYQLPVPSAANGRLELRLTLAYSTPVEPTQPTEYSQSSIDLTLRPHALRFAFNPPRGTSGTRQTLDVRSAEAAQLRIDGWRESQDPVSKPMTSSGRAELDLRAAGKWETVRHYRMNFGAGDMVAPRLDLAYLARRAGKLETVAPTVPFAVLATVIDRDQGGSLFDDATQQFAALRAVPRVASRVRVRAGAQRNWF